MPSEPVNVLCVRAWSLASQAVVMESISQGMSVPARSSTDAPASAKSASSVSRPCQRAVESPLVPRGHTKGVADRLAERVASGSSDRQALDSLDGGGELKVIDDHRLKPGGAVGALGEQAGVVQQR